MPKKRLDLTFPPSQSLKPIIYHLVKDFDVIPNIIRSEIQPGQEGRMLVELTGKKEDFTKSVEFLEKQGVVVKEAASDISRDEDLCVHCGLCTAVCRSSALTMDGDTLAFNKDKCVLCGACVIACPRRSITLEF